MKTAQDLYSENKKAGETKAESESSVDALASTLISMSTSIAKTKNDDSSESQTERTQLGKGILSNLASSKFKLLSSPIKSSEGQPDSVKGALQDYQLRKGEGQNSLPHHLCLTSFFFTNQRRMIY